MNEGILYVRQSGLLDVVMKQKIRELPSSIEPATQQINFGHTAIIFFAFLASLLFSGMLLGLEYLAVHFYSDKQ